MRSWPLGGLAALALALVVLAVWLGRQGDPQSESPSQGLLWPELAGTLDRVDRVEFRAAGNTVLETLERRDGRWRVAGRDGWWAHAARVEALLRELGRARKLEAKTAISERHALLGLADIALVEATGVGVDVTHAGTTRRLLVGNANPHSSGRFVRFADDAQAWLVDAPLDLPADPRQWLDRALLDVASRRVARLEVSAGQDATVGLVRTPGEGSGHALVGAGADREIDPSRVDTTATLFEGLRLDDVKRDPGTDVLAATDPIRVRLETVDGLRVDMETWREESERWVRLNVDFDEPTALGWVQAEIERDQRALDAASRPAPDAGGTAATPLDPSTFGIAPLDAGARLALLQSDAEALRARLQGWVFSLSPRKQAIIEASHDDHLMPAD